MPMLAVAGGLCHYFLHVVLCITIACSICISLEHVRHICKYCLLRIKNYWGRRRTELDSFPAKPLAPHVIKDASSFPKVLVQLPMFNELAVSEGVIDAACTLEWPASKLKVQVLDDSDCTQTRSLVDARVAEWRARGADVDLIRRTHRQGYKAGALQAGNQLVADKGYQYVAIFDADFRPHPDFLMKTVGYLEANDDVALVQTRWVFTNSDQSLLTKAQQIALNYHFKCEQTVHFAASCFFNFNGTGGVWRIAAIEGVGGWMSRTTVEDMDLSLRAFLAQWRSVYLEDVTCPSELPASLFAYRKQQHRWTCGPMQLLTKALPDVMASKQPWDRKLDVLYCYFGIGKFATHVVCLLFYCLLLPLTVLMPSLDIPMWALFQMPLMCTIGTCIYTPGSWAFVMVYVLYNNAMAVVKFWAVVCGLLGLPRANEWVVTTKMGGSGSTKGSTGPTVVPICRIYPMELLLGALLLLVSARGFATSARIGVSVFLGLQGLTFVAFGLNLVDCSFGMAFARRRSAHQAASVAATLKLQHMLRKHAYNLQAVTGSLPSFAKKENEAKV